MHAHSEGLKGSKASSALLKCLSFQGLVAEAEEGTDPMPGVTEVAQVEPEAGVQAGVHARHLMAEVGIKVQTVFFVERGVPLALRQFFALLCEDESSTLRSREDIARLSTEEVHPFSRRGFANNNLMERSHPQPIAGFQNPRRIREVGVVDIVVIVVELFTVRLLEGREGGRMVVASWHFNDAKVAQERELVGRNDRSGYRAGKEVVLGLLPVAKAIGAVFGRELQKHFKFRKPQPTAAKFLQKINLQTSQPGRICVDDFGHRFTLSGYFRELPNQLFHYNTF